MVWYFYQSQNKFRKRKERLNRKEIRKTLPVAQAESAQAAHPAHQGQGGLLPPPAPPSCSVECHRASRAAATPPACLEPSPAPPPDAWRRPGASPFHSPPPRTLSSSPSPISSTPAKNPGARRRTSVASEPVERHH